MISFSGRGKAVITAWGGPDDGAVLGEATGFEISTEPWPGFTDELRKLVENTRFSTAEGDEAARLLHDDGVAAEKVFPLLDSLSRMGICTACAVHALCLALKVPDGS